MSASDASTPQPALLPTVDPTHPDPSARQTVNARALFYEALRLDPANRPASLSLAQMALQPQATDELHEFEEKNAIERLQEIRRHPVNGLSRRRQFLVFLSRRQVPDRWTDPLWYRATYELAAHFINDSIGVNGKGKATARTDSLKLAERLVIAVEFMLAWRVARPPTLDRFLRVMEGPAIGMLAGIMEEMDRRHQKYEIFPQVRSALKLQDVSAKGLVEYLEKMPNLSYRTRYNLACIYASRSVPSTTHETDLKTAMQHLTVALESGTPSLIAWAPKDPSLDPLRRDVHYGPLFNTLVRRAEKDHPSKKPSKPPKTNPPPEVPEPAKTSPPPEIPEELGT